MEGCARKDVYCIVYIDGNLSPDMGARNTVGIGLSYRPASLCSLATQFQTRFQKSIPRPKLYSLAELVPRHRFLRSLKVKNSGSGGLVPQLYS
jgi:hypothetical protein